MKTEARSPLLVTAALICHEERLLIAQRKRTTTVEPGMWEFPGGKVEFGEAPKDCLKREILEELNLNIDVGDLYDVTSHVYVIEKASNAASEKIHVVLIFYICKLLGGELKHLDVEDAKWITLGELNDFEFAAADVEIVSKLNLDDQFIGRL